MKQVVKEAIRHLPDLFGLIPSEYSNLSTYIDASMKKALSKSQFKRLKNFPREEPNMLDQLEQYLRIVAVSNRDKHSTTRKIADVEHLGKDTSDSLNQQAETPDITHSMAHVQVAVSQTGIMVVSALRELKQQPTYAPRPAYAAGTQQQQQQKPTFNQPQDPPHSQKANAMETRTTVELECTTAAAKAIQSARLYLLWRSFTQSTTVSNSFSAYSGPTAERHDRTAELQEHDWAGQSVQ